MKSIDMRNIALILSLFAFSVMAIFAKVSVTNNTDVFIQAVFATVITCFVVTGSFLLSMHRGYWGVPNYVWLCITGGALLTLGFGGLFYSKDIHIEIVLIGTAVVVSSVIYPLTDNQEPIGQMEARSSANRKLGTEYLKQVLEERWKVGVRQINRHNIRNGSLAHGIHWFINKFGQTEECILEVFKITQRKPEKRFSDILLIYKELLGNEDEQLVESTPEINKLNQELAENGCRGKFFLSRNGWRVKTHAIVFCKVTGDLIVYCNPCMASNDKRA